LSNKPGTVANVQLNPSAGDFIADNISHPDQPVILLDGVQVALQTALDMDINRIDKVTILKDAAATSLYGVRGGNGVLLIQTRKPQPGNLNVTYSGQVQIATPDLSSYNMLNASDKLQLKKLQACITTTMHCIKTFITGKQRCKYRLAFCSNKKRYRHKALYRS
jgi:TonB-dependent SusC/RagA subfamily outer membrane receptor